MSVCGSLALLCGLLAIIPVPKAHCGGPVGCASLGWLLHLCSVFWSVLTPHIRWCGVWWCGLRSPCSTLFGRGGPLASLVSGRAPAWSGGTVFSIPYLVFVVWLVCSEHGYLLTWTWCHRCCPSPLVCFFRIFRTYFPHWLLVLLLGPHCCS